MLKRSISGLALALGSVFPTLVATNRTPIEDASGGNFACFAGGGLLALGAFTADPLAVIGGALLMTSC